MQILERSVFDQYFSLGTPCGVFILQDAVYSLYLNCSNFEVVCFVLEQVCDSNGVCHGVSQLFCGEVW